MCVKIIKGGGWNIIPEKFNSLALIVADSYLLPLYLQYLLFFRYIVPNPCIFESNVLQLSKMITVKLMDEL